jgi:hypothetical protein
MGILGLSGAHRGVWVDIVRIMCGKGELVFSVNAVNAVNTKRI